MTQELAHLFMGVPQRAVCKMSCAPPTDALFIVLFNFKSHSCPRLAYHLITASPTHWSNLLCGAVDSDTMKSIPAISALMSHGRSLTDVPSGRLSPKRRISEANGTVQTYVLSRSWLG